VIVRRYTSEDYEQARELVRKGGLGVLPEDLGGYGMVVEEDSRVTAFVWALVSDDSPIACVEYFVVSEEKKGQKIHGPLVMMKLFIELRKLGKRTIIGFLKEGSADVEGLVRCYSGTNMDQQKGWVVRGEIGQIIEGLKERYRG
jgi:hypothetical protein